MNFINRFFTAAETVSKARTLTVLRDMPEKQLRDVGIDPMLLADGVRAWPWRAKEDNWDPRKSTFKASVGSHIGQVDVNGVGTQCVENDKTAA